jgi:hypothetical protein
LISYLKTLNKGAEKKMGKLHELLAVEANRKNAFSKILDETKAVFKNKGHLFTESIRWQKLFKAEAGQEAESVVERVAMTSTVPMKLNYMAGFVTDYLDVCYQKELTNQDAKADLVVDGVELAHDVPATCLLGLEQKLARVRSVIDGIPTRVPGLEWVPDTGHKFQGVVKTKYPEVTNKTKKVITPFELSPATDKHPAQVEKLTEDKIIGKFEKTMWAGVLSPAEKSDVLKRMDKLIEACKIARMKANEQETSDLRIGETLMDFVLGENILSAGVGVEECAGVEEEEDN